MTRSSLRRAASVAAATALLAGGLAVGAGTAAAVDSPEPGISAAAATPHAATETVDNISVTKQVVGDGTVAPGQKVTYRTTFSVPRGVDRLITKIKDIHPAGFRYVKDSATVTYQIPLAGSKTDAVSPEVDIAGNYIRVAHPVGWSASVLGSRTVTFEATYLVPKDAEVGTALDSGLAFDVQGFQTSQSWNPMGVFATIRNLNPGEAVATGSADLGFGSSDGEGGTSGSAGSAIIEDPSGFIADIISGVLGNGS